MAHNLNESNGRASMMYVGQVPWHGLGTKLDKPATAGEAMQAAGLNFAVEKISLKTERFDLQIQGHFATLRTDTNEVLGVVGSRYLPIQNKDAFTTFDTLVGEGEAIYHTAGVLGRGERIWLLAKLPGYIRVSEDDLVEKFLLLMNSHDGSGPVRVKLTPIRVVCANTLATALGGSEQEVHIRHTLNAQMRLEKAHEVLGLSNHLYNQLANTFQGMQRKAINNAIARRYVHTLFPLPTIESNRNTTLAVHKKIFELIETGEGAEMSRGTLWGAYNAVTEYVDHYRLPNASPSSRLNFIWFGSGESLKKQAFKAALDTLN